MNDRPDDARRWTDPEDTDGLVGALAGLGADVDEPDEERLRILAGRVRRGAPTAPIAVAPVPRRFRTIGLAAASIVVVLAVSIVLTFGSGDAVVVAAFEDTRVELADGSELPIRIGTELPDGAVVQVAGFIDVGDGPLGPGRYVVDDGVLVADPLEAPGTTPSTTSTTEPVAPADDDDTAPTQEPDTTRSTTTSVPADVGVVDEPEPVRTTVSDAPVRTTVPARTTTTTTQPSADDRPAPVDGTATDRTRPTTTASTRPTTSEPARTTTTTTTTTVRPERTTTTVVRDRSDR